jgi:hypothetical protein
MFTLPGLSDYGAARHRRLGLPVRQLLTTACFGSLKRAFADQKQ